MTPAFQSLRQRGFSTFFALLREVILLLSPLEPGRTFDAQTSGQDYRLQC